MPPTFTSTPQRPTQLVIRTTVVLLGSLLAGLLHAECLFALWGWGVRHGGVDYFVFAPTVIAFAFNAALIICLLPTHFAAFRGKWLQFTALVFLVTFPSWYLGCYWAVNTYGS